MNLNDEPERLKEEEQIILNKLIAEMDEVINLLDKRIKDNIDKAKDIDISLNPDLYLSKLLNNKENKEAKEKRKKILKARDALYEKRLLLECSDDYGTDVVEIKVGLHSCQPFVTLWTMPICRNFILNNSCTKFKRTEKNKYGEEFCTNYKLLVKNEIKVRFTQVVKALNLYPGIFDERLLKKCKDSNFFSSEYIEKLTKEFDSDKYNPDNVAEIIADEFLQELLERRSTREFKNIVFSIQKKQGEIIQANYHKNMIVQGCAGSGKSMIMLHRLPIILYDNPNSLKRTNLFIITPSDMYIQMAENMRQQLEISDIKMGTIEQYYDYCIGKYSGHKPGEYGSIRHTAKIDNKIEKYIYSSECIIDLKKYYDQLSGTKNPVIEKGINIFKIDGKVLYKDITYLQKVTSKLLITQNVINENGRVISLYFNLIKKVIASMQRISVSLKYRKQNILREINKRISQNEEETVNAEKELTKLDENINEKAIVNREKIIEQAKDNIDRLKAEIYIINEDDKYFNSMIEYSKKIENNIKSFRTLKSEYSQNKMEDVYDAIENIGQLIGTFFMIAWECSMIEDKYGEYVEKIKYEIDKARVQVEVLQKTNEKYLSFKEYNEIIELRNQLNYIRESAAKNAYDMILKKVGIKENKNGKMPTQNYSAYLYLQALYQFQGSPNSEKEALLSIDEAQGIAPEEVRLLKNINGNDIVFNMFGDVHQHIENTKGIDKWSELSDIIDFDFYEMQENYRNSSQVTEYCNKVFNMKMKAINTAGKGVHKLNTEEEFKDSIVTQLLDEQRTGLAAILIGDDEEAKYILDIFAEYKEKFNDMTDGNSTLHHTRWNIMNIDDAKDLEFSSVISFTGRMSKNEKYIAYTRALDELFVYPVIVEINKYNKQQYLSKKIKSEIKNNIAEKTKHTASKIESDFSISDVRNFFEKNGLKVVDNRNVNGRLWVVGEKLEIRNIVNEAITKFGISGKYASSKEIKNRTGWFTKTKK